MDDDIPELHETPNMWVLLDDRAGNINQAVGVAEALKSPYTLKNIRYNSKVKLPNFIRGSSLMGVNVKDSDRLTEPWPEIVISAGRRIAPVARYIKKKAEGKCILIHLMWPGTASNDFDFIATPMHDSSHWGVELHRTLGAPNRITPASLFQAESMWKKTLEEKAPPGPYIALLVGGDTKKGPFTEEVARDLGMLASDFAKAKNSTLLVSTSRRTSEKAQKALVDAITAPYFMFDPKTERANPYNAFLALSDSIIVTGDSISMCSESCSTGKSVFIYAPDEIVPAKHKKLHKQLYKAGHALPFTGDNLTECNHHVPPEVRLQESEDLARKIRERYFD